MKTTITSHPDVEQTDHALDLSDYAPRRETDGLTRGELEAEITDIEGQIEFAELHHADELLITMLRHDLLRYRAELARCNGLSNSIPSLKEGVGKGTNWHPLTAAEILDLSTPEILWLWQGLIPVGSLFLLCAYMKVGKSTLAYRVALAIAQGLVCLDRATTKKGVLILAVEEHIRDIRRRLERFGMTPEMEIYVIVDRGQGRDLDKIREFV